MKIVGWSVFSLRVETTPKIFLLFFGLNILVLGGVVVGGGRGRGVGGAGEGEVGVHLSLFTTKKIPIP